MERRVFLGSTAASAAGLALSGCGSSSVDDLDGAVITDGKPVTFFGMARLDVPLAGASLEVVDAKGKSLLGAPITVTGSGLFYCTTPLPPNFRLVVNSPTAGRVYREVRNHDGTLRMVGVNVATHLLALYLDRYPTVALVTAEARVRNYLALPPGTSLDTGLDAQRGPFSSQVFMREAGKAGGFQAYSAGLVEYIHMGLRRPFILADESDGPSFGMTLLNNVAGDLVAAPLTAGINKAVGWMAGLLGFNLGGPSLRDISNQLDQMQTQLTAIQNQIAALGIEGAYQLAVNAIEPAVSSINTATNTLNIAASATQNNNGPVSNPGNSDLNNTLLPGSQWINAINLILDHLLGRNNLSSLVSLYNAVVMDRYGADSQPNQYQGYPLRSNVILNQLESQLQLYLGWVALGANLYAEVKHLSTRDASSGNFNNIAGPVMTAKVQINQIIADCTQAEQQLPGPLGSDDVLIDMENRVTWYLPVWPAWTDYNAYHCSPSSATYGSLQPPNRFQPATKKQLDALRQRLLKLNPSAPVAALATLGFDLTTNGIVVNNNKLHVWMYETDKNGNRVEGAYYRLEDGSTDTTKQLSTAAYASLQTLSFPLQEVEDNGATPLLGSAVPALPPGNLSILVNPWGPTRCRRWRTARPFQVAATLWSTTRDIPCRWARPRAASTT